MKKSVKYGIEVCPDSRSPDADDRSSGVGFAILLVAAFLVGVLVGIMTQ